MEASHGIGKEEIVVENMDNNEIISVLINLTQKKEEQLQDILKLTISQKILIANGDMQKLSEVIEHKQVLMENIQGLDMKFLEHYTKLKERLNIESIEEIDLKEYPQLKDLKLHIKNILEILKQIDSLDKQNKEKLSTDFEKIKEEMKKSKQQQQSTKLTANYQKKYFGGQGAFVDNKNK
jgi:flagellar FlgN protein